MTEWTTKQSGARNRIIAGAVGVTLIGCLLYGLFPRYARASAWHCIHGNSTLVGGRRVKLPTLWWVGDAGLLNEGLRVHDTYLLERACSPYKVPMAKIVVRPSFPDEVKNTDREELEATQESISRMRLNPASGWSDSFITIYSRHFPIYCTKKDYAPIGAVLATELTCHAAGLPYSIHYNGAQAYESEAEIILSSLE